MNEKLFYNVVFPFESDLAKEFIIVRWHKRAGEKVTKNEPLYNFENSYFEAEVPSPYSGVLIEILVDEKETASADMILARIESA